MAGFSALMPFPYQRKTSGNSLYTEMYHSAVCQADFGAVPVSDSQDKHKTVFPTSVGVMCDVDTLMSAQCAALVKHFVKNKTKQKTTKQTKNQTVWKNQKQRQSLW